MHNTSNIKKHTIQPLKKCKIVHPYIIKLYICDKNRNKLYLNNANYYETIQIIMP